MDKNAVIGLTLIFILFLVWQQFVAPSPEEIAVQQAQADSLQQEQAETGEVPADTLVADTTAAAAGGDSLRLARLSTKFGAFAPAAAGTAEIITLENDLMKVEFSNRGGNIARVELKGYSKVLEDAERKEVHLPLYLLEDEKNRFEYIIPVAGAAGGSVRTGDLYFTPEVRGNSVTFRAPVTGGGYFEQTYTLTDGSYLLDYDIRLEGLQEVVANNAQTIQLQWINYLDKIERNANYERNYSTLYFKPAEDDVDYCSCTSDDVEELNDQPLKWVSHAQQFFNSSLIADNTFSAGVLRTEMLTEEDEDLKVLQADLAIPFGRGPSETFGMSLYVGPNEFERLQAIGHDLTDIISFGQSIFGSINRWVIRPTFNFLNSFIGNVGISILILTLVVKLLLFPLTYKMLYSQSKMQAMKPYLEKAKAKHKDDQQAQQMETMKLYREYGVSPLGGCLPMLLQLPIWFALYRFFPASIDFRQKDFLWATDLSSYDAWVHLPFTIPFGFGAHISLFALLWAITTLIYTYYNTKHMDFSTQPAMKYMQYIMPVLFLGFFNNFAAGLTAYLLFSNLINIGQTVVTKNFIIDQDKVAAELEENYKKPKKKGGFQTRLEEALKEQQRRQAELEQQRNKKSKK